MADRPIAVDVYEELAEAYAAAVDTKPHNAYLERPATQSLIPDVSGKRVFDAGCGSGVYAEWLLDRGATVLAVDASPKMAAFTTARTGGRADVRVADLALPLDFLEHESFDLILSPLVLDYILDWRAVFAEFYRVLRPGGHCIVSVTHPFSDFTYFRSKAYFNTELVKSEWRGFKPVRLHMPSYRRSLADTLNPLTGAGFRIETLLEPRPTLDFKAADARG